MGQKERARRIATGCIDAGLRVCGGFLRVFFWLLGWRGISFLGKLAGDCLYLADRRRRRILEEELGRLFFGRRERADARAIARKSCEHFAMRLFESAFFGSLDRRTTEALVRGAGLEHIDQALARKKGVILLLSHFGSFLLPLPFLGFRGYAVNQITGKQVHRGVLAERIWLWRKREADRLPVRFRQVDRFLRPVYHALKGNEIVAIAFDGRDSSQWASVGFCARRARFSTGPFELARRTGAAIVPTFVIREPGGRHRIEFREEFKLSGAEGPERAIEEDVRTFAKMFESYVERYPCHFGMVLYKLRRMPADQATALFLDA
jgi:KDO2-lipid IV(A) lauroyltransferase